MCLRCGHPQGQTEADYPDDKSILYCKLCLQSCFTCGFSMSDGWEDRKRPPECRRCWGRKKQHETRAKRNIKHNQRMIRQLKSQKLKLELELMFLEDGTRRAKY